MSQPRIIKKYPNRRLYDTERSRYITLADVRELVEGHLDFVILEHKTDSDVTCRVLLQALLGPGEAGLSRDLLSKMIRSRKGHRRDG